MRVGGKIASPEVVTQDGNRRARTFMHVFPCNKIAAQQRLDTQSREKVRRYHGAINGFGVAISGEDKTIVGKSGQRREAFRGALPVQIIGEGRRVAAAG